MKTKTMTNMKTKIFISLALLFGAYTIAIADAEVVKTGLCNENKIIVKTRDNWFATGIYVDGTQLNQGDVIKNEEISLQLENRLELANQPGAGNYFIISINETIQEAEEAICE